MSSPAGIPCWGIDVLYGAGGIMNFRCFCVDALELLPLLLSLTLYLKVQCTVEWRGKKERRRYVHMDIAVSPT